MAKRRGNNEGSIYRRKNGKWQAQVSIDGSRIGKLFDTRKECNEWINQIAQQKTRGLTVHSAKTTFGEYLHQWLNDVQPSLKPTTISQYRGIVRNHIDRNLGHVKLSDITPRLIQNLYNAKLEEGRGKRTVEMIHAVIHRSLKMAVMYGLIGTNPTKAVQKPKHSAQLMKILIEDQIHTMLQAADGVGKRPLLQLAVTTGMRKGELLGLMWSDIDWASSALKVERQLQRIPNAGLVMLLPKTKSSLRTVKIGPETLSELGKHLDQQDEIRRAVGDSWTDNNLVFPSGIGTPKEPRNLVREFKSLLKKASLPNIRFHDLRHTAVSLMLMSNMPLMRITRQLGHAKPSTTLDIYGHLIPELESDAVTKIDQIVIPIATQLQQNPTLMKLNKKNP